MICETGVMGFFASNADAVPGDKALQVYSKTPLDQRIERSRIRFESELTFTRPTASGNSAGTKFARGLCQIFWVLPRSSGAI